MTYINTALRREVVERAGSCCEYCLINEDDENVSFHIEHIIAEKHGGETTEGNLCLSCPACNIYKGTDLASIDWETELIAPLFNPRKQKWSEHFHLNGIVIEPLTPEGRVTVFLLKLNQSERLAERYLWSQIGSYPCTAFETRE